MTYAEARASLQLEAEIALGAPMRASARQQRADEDAAAAAHARMAPQQEP